MAQDHYAGFTGGETEAQAGDTTCHGVTTQLQEQKQTSSSPRPVLSYHPISDGTTSRQQPPALAFPFSRHFCPVLVTRLGPPLKPSPGVCLIQANQLPALQQDWWRWVTKGGHRLLLTYW